MLELEGAGSSVRRVSTLIELSMVLAIITSIVGMATHSIFPMNIYDFAKMKC